MNIKSFLLICLLICTAGILTAQNQASDDTEAVLAQIDAYELENAGLEKEILGWQEELAQVETLVLNITQKIADLYSMLTDTRDEELKVQGTDALDRARDLRRKVKQKGRSLEENILKAQDTITENLKKMNRLYASLQ